MPPEPAESFTLPLKASYFHFPCTEAPVTRLVSLSEERVIIGLKCELSKPINYERFVSQLLSQEIVLSTHFFCQLFLSEKLKGWLNYTWMDHRQTSVQDQITTRDVKTGQKRLNYYWMVHCQQKERVVYANYMILWACGTGCTHVKSLTDRTEDRYWYTTEEVQRLVKPKSNKLQAATAFRHLKWGNTTLSDFIDKATILCDQCNCPGEWLLWDAVVLGLWSREAYFKFIEKGSNLTLNQALRLCRMKRSSEAKELHVTRVWQ